MSKDLKVTSSAAKNSRRRKKRRTLDVSDSSSSDSDSDIGSGTERKAEHIPVDDDVELTDEEPNLVSANIVNGVAVEKLEDDTIDELNSIPFTRTDLTSRYDSNHRDRNGNGNDTADLKKVSERIDIDRKKLNHINEASTKTRKEEIDRKNEFLGLIFENYGEDINSLREAPDFTNKSLVILANVLKEGSSMFDVETLKTILDSK